MGGGGQLQQVIAPAESSLATVSVDHNSQDAARYTYYPAVQTNDGNQGGKLKNFVYMLYSSVLIHT